MPCHHLTLSTPDRMPLARDEGRRRRLVARLAQLAGRKLVLFSLVDDHLHLVVTGSRTRAGQLARGFSQSLRWEVGHPLAPSHIRPVEGRRHLLTLVDDLLGQPARHGLDAHPALWTGSCFQDLVGARVLPDLDLQLSSLLPRLRPGELFRAVGLDPARLVAVDDATIRRLGPERLVDAASAALCVEPDLASRHAATVRAKRAVVAVADQAGLRTTPVAAALGMTSRNVRRLRDRPADHLAAHALRVRLSLELACPRPPGRHHLPFRTQRRP